MVSLATLLSHSLQLSEVSTILNKDIATKPVADMGNWIHIVSVKHMTDIKTSSTAPQCEDNRRYWRHSNRLAVTNIASPLSALPGETKTGTFKGQAF